MNELVLSFVIVESAIDEEDSGEQRLRSDQMYDCVICGQSSSSTCDRPLAVAVLLQSTTGNQNNDTVYDR